MSLSDKNEFNKIAVIRAFILDALLCFEGQPQHLLQISFQQAIRIWKSWDLKVDNRTLLEIFWRVDCLLRLKSP